MFENGVLTQTLLIYGMWLILIHTHTHKSEINLSPRISDTVLWIVF